MPPAARGAMPQDTGAPTPAPPLPAAADTLGFGEQTNRMTVAVSVAGKGPFPFIVDTGAERSVLSHELANMLGLAAGGKARLFDFGGVSTVETVKVPSLTVGKLTTAAVDAPSLGAANIGAPGMLGIDALQGHKVVIDFGRRRMTLVPSRRHAIGQVVVRAQDRVGQLIVTSATLDGQPISVMIDTGSWVSVGNGAMRRLLRQAPRPLGPITVGTVTGRSFAAAYVAVDNLKISGFRFDNFALVFADVAPFARFGLSDRPALIFGMSSLQLFRRVEIDFANREIGFSLPRPPIDFNDICRGGASNCRSF